MKKFSGPASNALARELAGRLRADGPAAQGAIDIRMRRLERCVWATKAARVRRYYRRF